MEDKMLDVILIDDKEFFKLDTIDKYNYFAEINDSSNICVLKEIEENGEKNLIPLEQIEIEKALILYYKKTNE